MRLSSIQRQTLLDISSGITFTGRVRTLSSLKRRRLIEYELGEEPWLTSEGETVLRQFDDSDSDAEDEDVVEAAYFLGKQTVENPKLAAIALFGFVLGSLVRKK